jgi:hypothetical protein
MLSPDGLPHSDASTAQPKNGGCDNHDSFGDDIGQANDANVADVVTETNLGIQGPFLQNFFGSLFFFGHH